MVKNHLKRIALPRTWNVPRKAINKTKAKFVSKPNPGKTLANCLSLNNFLKDAVKLVPTRREVKYVIRYKGVEVDGKNIIDEKCPVGIFDVVSIPEIKQSYRLTFDARGKLAAILIDEKEAGILIKRVEGKSKLSDGKFQFHLFEGGNLTGTGKEYTTGDVLVLSGKEVKHVLKLHPKNTVMLVAGQHIGKIGKVVEIKGAKIFIEDADGTNFETLTKYAYVINDGKFSIKVR